MAFRILLADLDENRAWIADRLRSLGLEVCWARTQSEALTLLKTGNIAWVYLGKSFAPTTQFLRQAQAETAASVIGLDSQPCTAENLCLDLAAPDAQIDIFEQALARQLWSQALKAAAGDASRRASTAQGLQHQLRSVNTRLSLLQESARRLFLHTDGERTLQEILNTVSRFSSGASVCALACRRDGLAPVMARGLPPEKLAQGPLQAQVSAWTRVESFAPELKDAEATTLVTSLIGVTQFFVLPLGVRGNPHHLLIVGCAAGLADRAALRNYVPMADLALRNARRLRDLRRLAERDALTGLLNTAALQQSIRVELKRHVRQHLPLSVAYLDIDGFKSINDTLGHPAGDKVLRRLADTLRRECRETDLLARCGGDEFAVVLTDTGPTVALNKLSRLLEAARRSLSTNGAITVSAGMASFPQHGRSAAGLLQAADAALYRAKREGKNRVCAYVPPAETDGVPTTPEASSQRR